MSDSMRDIKAEVGLHCLHCGQSQLPPAREQLDSWTCSYCFSGFISLAMLKNLLPRELVNKFDARAPHPRWGRKCPKCHVHMEVTMVVDGQGESTVRADFDVCHPCRLIWFDGGGIVKILKLRDPQEMIAHFARATKYIPQNTPDEPRGIHAKPKVPEEETPSNFKAATLGKAVGAAWLLGGFLKLLGGDGIGLGLGFALTGGAAYLLTLVPYRELLFPKDRWRSPVNKLMWFAVAVAAFTISIFVYDYFFAAFRQVAAGGKGGRLSGTLVGGLAEFVRSPTFLAYIASAFVGITAAMVDEPARKKRP